MRKQLAGLAVVLVAAVAVGAANAEDGQQWSGHRITVETRNLFVGFDAGALLLGAITPAQAWTTLVASDPEGRAQSWADEIAAARPDVVGLQEATLIRTGPFLDPAPATTVAFDFVALLLDALAERGLTYAAVATIENLDAEAPVFLPPAPFDARVTDRDVLLVRADRQTGNLKVPGTAAGNFQTMVPPVSGFTVKRGWTAADLKLHGRTVRVVNTHLEAFSPLVAAGQALELVAGAAGAPGPTILLGDMNAEAGEPAYNVFAGAGFVDVWPLVGSGAGLTCCHDDLTTSIPYDERIDLVFVKGGITPLSAHVIGDVPGPSFPFFPSDHAGVVATLALP